MEDESASYSETGVACVEDGTEEVSIKQEDSIDIKEDNLPTGPARSRAVLKIIVLLIAEYGSTA
jgi:hypothetical protein